MPVTQRCDTHTLEHALTCKWKRHRRCLGSLIVNPLQRHSLLSIATSHILIGLAGLFLERDKRASVVCVEDITVGEKVILCCVSSCNPWQISLLQSPSNVRSSSVNTSQCHWTIADRLFWNVRVTNASQPARLRARLVSARERGFVAQSNGVPSMLSPGVSLSISKPHIFISGNLSPIVPAPFKKYRMESYTIQHNHYTC